MMSASTLRTVMDAADAIGAAERQFENAIIHALPPGQPVAWEWNGRTQQGYIQSHCYRDDFWVRNAKTGKVVKIGVLSMIQAELKS